MLRTINVSGEGIIEAVPDMVTVRFGVVTRSTDPEEARRLNADAASETMNAVRALGVDERKIQVETLRLDPAREYNQQTRRYDEIGFDAIRVVVVKLEDLDMLPTLIAEVVQKGANRLEGIAYGLQDRQPLKRAALEQALLDAQAKADLMALTLGAERGLVQQISEQGVQMPRPVYREMALASTKMADAAPAPDAYAAGELAVRATVQVVFLIK
ncbi:MAG: SIMPL domain-containing protein [Bacteroidota bacterium]